MSEHGARQIRWAENVGRFPFQLESGRMGSAVNRGRGILTAYSGAASTYLRLLPLGSATATWTFRPAGWETADSATSLVLGDGTIAVVTDSGSSTVALQLAIDR